MRWLVVVVAIVSGCASRPKPNSTAAPHSVAARARLTAPIRVAMMMRDLARKEHLNVEVRGDGDALELTVTGDDAMLGCRYLVVSVVAALAKEREAELAPLRDKRDSAVARLGVIEATLEMTPAEAELPTWETAQARAKKRLASKEASKPLAREQAVAIKHELELKTSYGPQHPLVKQAAAVTKVLADQRAREEQLESEAAAQELAALEKMPTSSRTPVDVKTLRRGLLVKRLSAPGVTAERGVDADAPLELRAIAFEHLAVRIERARDALVYGDAHPKMIASKVRLADLEKAFASLLSDAIARLSSGAVLPQTEAEELRRERSDLIRQLEDLARAEQKILLSPGVTIARHCAS